MFFNDFLSFLKFDMESRGIRLAKEDSMTIDGAILTADSHGDKFQCNKATYLSLLITLFTNLRIFFTSLKINRYFPHV